MKTNQLIQQPEGRTFEFKEDLPKKANLNKTIVAFANDAGGTLILGVKDKPRTIIGIIEQWGNGLKLISDELKTYSEIDFEWTQPGMSFRATFLRTNYKEELELKQESRQELEPELEQESYFSKILFFLKQKPMSRKEISMALELKSISGYLNKIIAKLFDNQFIERTIPDKPKSSKQQYRITKKGKLFVKILKEKSV